MAAATAEKTKSEKAEKPAKAKLEVTEVANRFVPECDTLGLKDPCKGMWVVQGRPGLYNFKGNLKPTGAAPELTEHQVMANYDSNGTLAPALFERLVDLEKVIVAQIQG